MAVGRGAHQDQDALAIFFEADVEVHAIPYKTAEGVADFHAAGRHTYITELLRSGASLVEARELARHSDVRMTMRYTHIGLDDQALAVAKLPSLTVATEDDSETGEPPAEVEEPESCPRSGHAPAVAPCQDTSTNGDSGVWESANENPCGDKGYRQKSPSDGAFQKWRRRESNPEADCDTALQNKALCEFKYGVAADWQRILQHSELCRGSDNNAIHSLGIVVAAWFQLPAVTREVIVALVQAT